MSIDARSEGRSGPDPRSEGRSGPDPRSEGRSGPGPDPRLAIVLDRDDLDDALELAEAVRPWFGVAKVGYELYAAAGPAAVVALRDIGYAVFLDLKLHDIPTTVGRGARVLGRLGVSYLNFHVQGGETMLRAGAEGLAQGAAEAGHPPPVPLGVTVLTSDAAAPGLVAERAALALASGMGGVVCAATDIAEVKGVGPTLVTMVPGIREEGSNRDDQTRVATAREAIAAGADVLVVGRTVTAATDPVAAAARLHASL
ncbi:MAG TPA: orotidine-5'-phosphate decarboxylase [Acidimicrobiales bacterium]|nr:orotidine-5'-phosphate decarboxylase [Acidimicrobiales bacterium]